ncbi:MAG: hypothetical protein IRY99_05875 [Isosphaeraceae bacterium]|nr:hypothetical protein [Isosphaeraceae bacterium]
MAVVYCAPEANGAEFGDYEEDPFEYLADLLAQIRAEIMKGDTSFLQAVASFYEAGKEDEGEEEEEEEETEGKEAGPPPAALRGDMTKAELQQECAARGIAFRKSWTKDQLRTALAAPSRPAPKPKRPGQPARLSKAAKEIVDQLVRA